MMNETRLYLGVDASEKITKLERDLEIRNRLFIVKELFDLGEVSKEDYVDTLKNAEKYYREH